MDCLVIYKCLCDRTRLRILNLLKRGPLCVCHVQQALDETQVKTSKALIYMKRCGLIESVRKANWNIYRLPRTPNPILAENLKCLQDITFQDPDFRADIRRLKKLDTSAACLPELEITS